MRETMIEEKRSAYGQVSDLLASALVDFAQNKVFDAIAKTEQATFIMRETQSIRQASYLATNR
jgi:hypothetical protein